MPTRTRAGTVWLTLLTIASVFSLLGAVLGIIRYGELERQRDQDRIEFDAGSCERGNENRERQKKIAIAGAQLDKDIIRLLVGDVRLEEIEKRLAPAFASYEALVEEIEQVDCDALLAEAAK